VRPGSFLAEGFDALEAFEVSDAVLGHGALPFEDASEQGLGCEMNDQFQFLTHDAQDFILGQGEDLFVARATQKATDDGAVVGRGGETCCGRTWRPAGVCLRCGARENQSQALRLRR